MGLLAAMYLTVVSRLHCLPTQREEGMGEHDAQTQMDKWPQLTAEYLIAGRKRASSQNADRSVMQCTYFLAQVLVEKVSQVLLVALVLLQRAISNANRREKES